MRVLFLETRGAGRKPRPHEEDHALRKAAENGSVGVGRLGGGPGASLDPSVLPSVVLIAFHLLGHKVHDEGDVVNAFKKTDASTTEVEPAKNFFENLHYNATVGLSAQFGNLKGFV